MQPRRLGLFGGTFDPPHNGHVAALHALWRTGRYEEILVTVAGDPYEKSATRSLSPAPLRLEMAHAAFDGLDGVRVSGREIRRSGETYTVDTVRELLQEGWTVELLVGADTALGLAQWHDATELANLVTVGVVPRDGVEVNLGPAWRAAVVPMAPYDLSSTFIRQEQAAGHEISMYLPPGVIALYQQGQG